MHLSLLVGRFVKTKVICVRNKEKSWFINDCRCAFDHRQETHLRWTRDHSRVNRDKFVHYQRMTNVVYAEAERHIGNW